MTDIELSYLLQKYRNHDISQDEFEKLKLWIDESEDNRNIVRNIIKSYKTEERYNAYLGTSGSDGWDKISRQIKRRPMIHRLRWTASVAASLVICLTIGSIIYFSNNSNDGAFVYAKVQHIVTLTLTTDVT